MKYIIIAILFLNPILAESQKRKKKNEQVVKETKSSPKVLIDCNTVSPVFFLPEGVTGAERSDTESAYNDLISLEFNAYPQMTVYQSTVESTKLKDYLSKWIAESEPNTVDYNYGLQNEGLIVLNNLLASETKGVYKEEMFLTEQFGTSMKVGLEISTDTTEKPRLWYHNNRLYRETRLEIEPTYIDYDGVGDPVYNPEDLDAFGNPIYRELFVYNMPESEIDLSILEFFESVRLLSSGRLQKQIKGLSFTYDGPDHTKDFLAPVYLNSKSVENGQLYMKDVVSSLLIDNQASGISVYGLENIVVELLQFAKEGAYDIYEGSYDDEMNISLLEHSASSGSISSVPSDKLFDSDEDGRKFLQTVYMYDSVPAPTGVDMYGMPIYDPNDIDDYGNPIIHIGKDIHSLAIDDIAGIQLLEDWYINEETGELSKRIKGFTLLAYNLGRDGETVHGVDHELGRRFYFRFKN